MSEHSLEVSKGETSTYENSLIGKLSHMTVSGEKEFITIVSEGRRRTP